MPEITRVALISIPPGWLSFKLPRLFCYFPPPHIFPSILRGWVALLHYVVIIQGAGFMGRIAWNLKTFWEHVQAQFWSRMYEMSQLGFGYLLVFSLFASVLHQILRDFLFGGPFVCVWE